MKRKICVITGTCADLIHGGEATEGVFDEAIKHSVTKMAYLHFAAAEEYRKRVIQLSMRMHGLMWDSGRNTAKEH